MKTTTRKRRGFTLVELLVVIAIIATLAGVGVPALIKRQKDGYRAEAIMNAGQIGKTLFSFEQEYGSYPDDQTATDITTNLSVTVPGSPGKANYYFAQLVSSGYLDQEKPFYCRATYTKQPDNNMQSSELLKKGECGFGYVMKTGGEGLSSASNSAIPIVVASLLEGATDDTFDPEVYNQKAVVLRIDTSVRVEQLRPSDKKIAIGAGKTLLQTGTGTVWENGNITPQMIGPDY